MSSSVLSRKARQQRFNRRVRRIALLLLFGLAVVGAAIVLLGIFGWVLEPSVADDSDYDPPAEGSGPTKELASIG